MTALTENEIAACIAAGFPNGEVTVTGDGRHFEALIICSSFAGKLPLQRHRMVYAALGNHMESNIHALSIRALTPDEQQNQ